MVATITTIITRRTSASDVIFPRRAGCDTFQRMSISPALDPSFSLRYPIGKFDRSRLDRAENIAAIAALPSTLREAVAGLNDEQLDTPYREGGWTVRQLVHHVADSHINAYVRMRLALTEDWPTIKPYDEAEWAKLRGCADASGRGFAFAAGGSASPLGCFAAVADGGGLGTRICASGEWAGVAGDGGGDLRLAQPAPCGACDGTAEADGVVRAS